MGGTMATNSGYMTLDHVSHAVIFDSSYTTNWLGGSHTARSGETHQNTWSGTENHKQKEKIHIGKNIETTYNTIMKIRDRYNWMDHSSSSGWKKQSLVKTPKKADPLLNKEKQEGARNSSECGEEWTVTGQIKASIWLNHLSWWPSERQLQSCKCPRNCTQKRLQWNNPVLQLQQSTTRTCAPWWLPHTEGYATPNNS